MVIILPRTVPTGSSVTDGCCFDLELCWLSNNLDSPESYCLARKLDYWGSTRLEPLLLKSAPSNLLVFFELTILLALLKASYPMAIFITSSTYLMHLWECLFFSANNIIPEQSSHASWIISECSKSLCSFSLSSLPTNAQSLQLTFRYLQFLKWSGMSSKCSGVMQQASSSLLY